MKFKIIICTILVGVFIFLVGDIFAATSTPGLVNKINSAFKKIQGYLEKISTPIAAVCLASGILIRKLSLGDEYKMVLGKRIIINTVVGYAAIQLLDLIIKFIETVIK